jgi:small GTP-binding protein
MQHCWEADPHERPTMHYVVAALSTYKALDCIFGRNLSFFRTYQQRVRHSDSPHSYKPNTPASGNYRDKVVFIGEESTGKTMLFNRIRGEEYESTTRVTVQAAIDMIDVTYRSHKAETLQLWDTAGQEKWRSVTQSYLRDCACAIVVFALPDRPSFDELPFWVNFIKEHNVPFILIGTQADFEKPREVETQIADQFGMDQEALAYLEVSAKWDDCVHEVLAQVEVALAEIGASFIVSTERPVSDVERKKGCC